MAVATRTITGTIADPSGAAWASQNVIFHLLTSLATTSDDAVLKKTYTVTTDGNGQFTATLAVPDSNAWQYRCTLPDGEKFIFNLEAGAATTLGAIIDDANLSATVSASTLSSYIRYDEVLDEDGMDSNSATLVASQQSIKAYVDSQVVSAGVDTDGSPVADDFAQFVDGNTLKGLSATEFRSAINVEDGADVTDTANVTAAGAVMDSEVTDLAGIKALDTSTLQVKPAEGAFVDGDKTKLDGIETGADVTDTANVTSAGALMDSELADLAGVKALDTSTLQAKPAEGAFVDGDKTKLDGIETAADVTDTANVDAAGATMNTDTDVSGNSWVLDQDDMTGNDNTKVPTQQSVKAYVDSSVDTNEYIVIAVSDESTDLTTGTAKVTFRMPYAMTLSAVRASVTTAPTGSTIIVDINEGGSTILGTKLSIDASEKTSTTAASAATITDSALADDAEITIDIDQIGSSTAGAGLKVYLIGSR